VSFFASFSKYTAIAFDASSAADNVAAFYAHARNSHSHAADNATAFYAPFAK
jgi:hypothetical protein